MGRGNALLVLYVDVWEGGSNPHIAKKKVRHARQWPSGRPRIFLFAVSLVADPVVKRSIIIIMIMAGVGTANRLTWHLPTHKVVKRILMPSFWMLSKTARTLWRIWSLQNNSVCKRFASTEKRPHDKCLCAASVCFKMYTNACVCVYFSKWLYKAAFWWKAFTDFFPPRLILRPKRSCDDDETPCVLCVCSFTWRRQPHVSFPRLQQSGTWSFRPPRCCLCRHGKGFELPVWLPSWHPFCKTRGEWVSKWLHTHTKRNTAVLPSSFSFAVELTCSMWSLRLAYSSFHPWCVCVYVLAAVLVGAIESFAKIRSRTIYLSRLRIVRSWWKRDAKGGATLFTSRRNQNNGSLPMSFELISCWNHTWQHEKSKKVLKDEKCEVVLTYLWGTSLIG